MGNIVHILGGGTFSHVRTHLSIATPAFGQTARRLHDLFGPSSVLHLTKMADSNSKLLTNEDVGHLIDQLVAEPTTRAIILNVAFCDFEGSVFDAREGDLSGKYAKRLQSRNYDLVNGDTCLGEPIQLRKAEKIISRIRRDRKDIFLVAFKTTSGATPHEQYLAGLNLLKENSANLVLANDVVTRHNMIIAPEETRYCETHDREEVLESLVDMVNHRITNTFTRSTVVNGDLVDFQNDDRVPDNLRQVVNHMVGRGAYRAFRNKTAGHFAVRLGEGRCLTSRRKVNYNVDHGLDLVEIEYDGDEKVIAHGAKPSVGGQSQRIIFDQHSDVDCIAHAHVEMRKDARDANYIGFASQFPNECGSKSCGETTSRNLQSQDGHIKAVMLDNHGPNIVFGRNIPAEEVIDFIEANFDLESKTGGLLEV